MFIILTVYTVIGSVLSSSCQVENIENPLGSFGRVEADNGVHMRVEYLYLSGFSWFFILLLSLTVESNSCFFQIVLQGQDNRQGRGSNVGEKSFRCEYEGCGKLYTTAHHLKVSVGVLWLLVHVLYMCSWKKKKFCCVACAYSSVGLLKHNFSLTASSYDVGYSFAISASLLHSFVCVSFRYTSAPTLETNHTSVTIPAVGRSLQQVAVSWTF